MRRIIFVVMCLMLSGAAGAQEEKHSANPSFEYQIARTHEIAPHRRTIPFEGITSGANQLHLTLTISPTGDVVDASAEGEPETLKVWPQLQGEVRSWKFTPFEMDGKAVTAEIDEYMDLVPPERLPKIRVPAPILRPESKVSIILRRTGCFGSCPSYTVTVGTDGIVFDGRSFVAASGKHSDSISRDEIFALAKRFVVADFYSFDAKYLANVSDNPTFIVSIEIDGHKKEVIDYVGQWEGMPAVVVELEDAVDKVARTERWIDGGDGLVTALVAEKFNFQSFAAQVVLKEAVTRGKAETVRELLKAGVPLKPFPAPKTKRNVTVPFEDVGWLNAASEQPEIIRTLIDAGASKDDQDDKDLGLLLAAGSGKLEGVRALIAYGANPNADFTNLTVTSSRGIFLFQTKGPGSVLIYAARSGNPEMVREILTYHPNLEAKDREGKTAIFAPGENAPRDKNGSRVQCLRLLVQAGASVNARDNKGNTPLHEANFTDVEEELLRLGADPNVRNKNGETPIFTGSDNAAIPILIEHGADLSIRNNKGQTVMEAAKDKGINREKALREAIEKMKKDQQ